MSSISIIGSGISGLSAACFAAKAGHDVTVFEKNASIGGRARQLIVEGYTFDMGPSWYWMPDIFEKFFNQFGKKVSDFYKLVKLNPGFRIWFGDGDAMDVPSDIESLYRLFEDIEPGSADSLKRYLADAEFKYKMGMKKLAYKPGLNWSEFLDSDVLPSLFKLSIFNSMSSHVRTYFSNPRLVALMEFPVLFLGAMPDNIPSLYSLMNYAALEQGTFYPMGGMYQVIDAMQQVAKDAGVKFQLNQKIRKIAIHNGVAHKIKTDDDEFDTHAVIASADYHHVEQSLLEPKYRNYKTRYWNSKTFAPSCLVFYLGVNKRIKNIQHHNLFFDTDFDTHSREIYEFPRWPTAPLFYVCCPSKTDDSVAPKGHENLFVLMPIANGLNDHPETQERYYHILLDRMERYCGEPIKENVVYKKSYCISDFMKDYNAFGGNGYGLANTLAQTAVLKPKMRNKRIHNLFYAGQLTVPGPGMPPCLISGQIAAEQLIQHLKRNIQ